MADSRGRDCRCGRDGAVVRATDKTSRSVAGKRFDAALAWAANPQATAGVRVDSALVVIDAHLNAIVRCPAGWGDVQSAEVAFCELLFLRAVLVGARPARWGGEALQRAKRRAFESHNGPCSNWIARDAFDVLAPMLAVALRAERKRMGVPSKVPMQRTRKAAK